MARASYLGLYASGELERRVVALERLLEACTVCPLDCGNNRLRGELARCYSGALPVVSSYTPHFGEEPALTGRHGAGNVFFGNCNLRCVYCQNYQISQAHKAQIKNEVTHERLAEMMLELQSRGCHNINFVSPTHFAPQMARAVLLAARRGLKLPIVYNTNAYDSVEVLGLLDHVVDIYLPDLKYADSSDGYTYSKVPNYTEHARAALKEMYRQTGDELVFGADGMLARGLVIRLLVLPNDIAGVRESLEWIRASLSPRVAVSLMAQYYATNKAATDERFMLLSRRINESEWWRAVSLLEELGMEEGWMQEYDGASHYYRPDFRNPETPFKDIRDFQT
ncbi:MAG: putative pyruvate formate lyase activating enzyme [Acidobacteriota bacterium]|jgi:putative pyruvate formate lyase activating enzyme|nr:putative pyruvate formate lyase activating enzyme [Acidobacteriota bacterium]